MNLLAQVPDKAKYLLYLYSKEMNTIWQSYAHRQMLAPWLFSFILLNQILAQSDESGLMNDTCEKAVTIAPGSSTTGSTVGLSSIQSSTEIGLLQCAGDIFEINNPGLWYMYQADASRVLKLSTCAEETNFSNRITAFTVTEEGDCSSRTCVASSIITDPNCPYENSTVLELSTVSGNSYSILVHDQYMDSSGEFGFSVGDISPAPNGTACENAIDLPQNQTLQGTTVGSSSVSESLTRTPCVKGGPRNPGVFYYIPPATVRSNVSISVTGALIPFDIWIYQGSSCDELVCQEITTNTESITTRASWSTEVNKDSYFVYVSAATDSEESVTDRFGILMVQESTTNTETLSTASRGPNYSILNDLLSLVVVYIILVSFA